MKFKSPQFFKTTLAFLLMIGVSSKSNAQNVSLNWAKSMGGNDYEVGSSVAIDAQGNTYTTGYYKGIADFDPGLGVFNLTSVANGSAFTYDTYIAKYNINGELVWAKSIGGTSPNDQAFKILLDNLGNLYVTGNFGSTGMSADFDPGVNQAVLNSRGGHDGFVAKYDTAGNYLWVRGMGGKGWDYAYTIATDPTGAVYVTGNFSDTIRFDTGAGTNTFDIIATSAQNAYLAKYSPSGNLVWANRIGGSSTVSGQNLVADVYGHIYLSGPLQGTADFDPGSLVANLTSNGSGDVFLAKYDTSGNYIWAKNFGGSGGDGPTNLTLDPANLNIYVIGWFANTVDFDPGPAVQNLTAATGANNFLAKYDSSGNYVSAVTMGGNTRSIQASTTGDLYITGGFTGTVDFDPGIAFENLTSAGSSDIFLAKYTSQSGYLWAGRMGGLNSESGSEVVLGQTGQIYLTGSYVGTADFDPSASNYNLSSVAGSNDVFLVKLTDGCPSFSSFNQTSCDSFAFNGTTYTTSGTYVDTFTSSSNCDSFVTINLTINTSSLVPTIVIEECDSVVINGIGYTSSGIYTQTTTKVNGCDSVLTFDVTIKGHTDESTLNETACDSFFFNGVYYSLPGTYLITLVNQAGCDSLVTLNLSINPSPVATITQNGSLLTASLGDSYQWLNCDSNLPIEGANSRNYSVETTGRYAVIVTSNGCSDTSECLTAEGLGIDLLGTGNTITLYPNPAKGIVYVTATQSLSNASLRVVNALGQVFAIARNINGKVQAIDVSLLPAGLYFVEIIEDLNKLNVKFVKN